MKWTAVHCGVFGEPQGFYDERYSNALTGRMADFGHTVEYVHDDDMPEALRYRGNWGMLSLYNPDLDAGTNGVIYAIGIDTVFLKDPALVRDALDEAHAESGADIIGSVCASDGLFNTNGLQIVQGSPGAMAVWNAALENDFFVPRGLKRGPMPDRLVEHKVVRRFAYKYTSTYRTGLVQSYKSHIGKFPRKHIGHPPLEDIVGFAFHGHPNPHEVLADKSWPLQDIIMENWGKYAGY